jgi:hypothetical protein
MIPASYSAFETLKILFAIPPPDQGGVEQRIGASFQDHVAAKYCIEMLGEGCEHSQVWCESHDDIVLVFYQNSIWRCEFVQAKASMSHGLWSKHELGRKTKNKKGVSKPCIIERLLQHDCVPCSCGFRLVTRENTNEDLKILKAPLGSPDRISGEKELIALATAFEKKISPFSSHNGNNAEFWVRNTVIQVLGEEQAVAADNRLKLHLFAETQGILLRTAKCELLYERILSMIQSASKKLWGQNPLAKVLTREDFKVFVIAELQRGGESSIEDHERLRTKMEKATVASPDIESALELRRRYLSEVFEPQYLDSEFRNIVEGEVLARLHVLRAKRNTARKPEKDSEFHARCIQNVRELKQSFPGSSPPEFVLLGCMYEITARCRHQFHKSEE